MSECLEGRGSELLFLCSAVRTHLINMAPVQLELTWPTFVALRKKWAGKVLLLKITHSKAWLVLSCLH